MTPVPDLVLYTRARCHLCEEAREAVRLVIEDRRSRGLRVPRVVERDIDADEDLHRRLFDRIPVIEIDGRRAELVVSVGKVRRLLAEALGDTPSGVAAEWS